MPKTVLESMHKSETKIIKESEETVMATYNVQKNHKVEKQSHAYKQRLILLPLWFMRSRRL